MQGLLEHLTCPICYNLFRDPFVIKICQHTFCKDCIFSAIQVKHACPVCRKPMGWENDLEPNRVIANIINDNRFALSEDRPKGDSVNTVLKLSITEKYAPNWKSRQGIREIVQNWYDGINEQVTEISHSELIDLRSNHEKFSITKTTTKPIDGPKISKYTATFGDKEYGEIEYNHATHFLSLTNNNVMLSRKILLLGASSKVGKEYLVGQFGEGLKIGILALTREKKPVAMHTNNEHWSFGLEYDGQYGESVLGVTVEREKSEKEKKNSNTCTTVQGITPEEWKLFSHDFLFLTKPKEYCDTINGTLLLDKVHKHKLFVKGFWICDLKDSGLVFGVNLYHMELDRDRRAVVQKHDIENKVADIWSKAIVERKDLLPIFYDLLMMNDEMISKAQWYITEEGVKLLSSYFTTTQGVDAQPVLNTRAEDVMIVEQQLKKKAVLCPEPLYNILIKSSDLRGLDEQLQAYNNMANKKVTRDHLSPEEQSTLNSVVALLHTIIEPAHLSVKNIEIFESNFGGSGRSSDFGQWKNEKIQLSRNIFKVESVHEQFNRCTSISTGVSRAKEEKCRCVETFMMTLLISLRAEAKCTNFSMRQGFEKVMMERLMEKFMVMMLAGK